MSYTLKELVNCLNLNETFNENFECKMCVLNMLTRRTLEQVNVLQSKFSDWRCEIQSWLRKSTSAHFEPRPSYNAKELLTQKDEQEPWWYLLQNLLSHIYPLLVSPNICKNKFKLWTNKCKSAEEKKGGNWRMTAVTEENRKCSW